MEAGDWLVVFTDGVVEAVNEADTEYGEERLISVVNAGADMSPVNMLSRTMADLNLFVGNTPQRDDITCLLIKAQSPVQESRPVLSARQTDIDFYRRDSLRDNPGQGRQVLHHLIGIIQLWAVRLLTWTSPRRDPNDRSGKENLTAADVCWSAETKPAGLSAGLRQSIRMASPPRHDRLSLEGPLELSASKECVDYLADR